MENPRKALEFISVLLPVSTDSYDECEIIIGFVRPSVCPFITRWYCIKRQAELIVKQSMLDDSEAVSLFH